MAVIATTFALVAVFLPTAFMAGVPGLFFKQFGWTAVLAILASLVVARLLTPMMAAYLLKPRKRHKADDGLPEGGFATAGFADQAQRFAGRDGETDAVDGMDRAEPAPEMDDQILDGEQGTHVAASVGAAKQATRRPAPAGSNGGRSVRQTSMTFGQRGAKAQPSGNASSGGTMPGISARRCGVTPVSRRGVAPSRPSV